MTAVKVAALLAAAYLGLAALLAWLSRRMSWTGSAPWPRTDDDLRTIDDARAEFEDRMHVVGVHAHNDGRTVARRTMPEPWLSIPCSSGRHHLCRPDREDCFCPCGHGGFDEAKAAS